jgi:hypothetical protein
MPLTTAQLLSEIQNDPKALGYAAFISSHSDEGIASLINLKTGSGSGSVNIGVLLSYQIFNCFDRTEWAALTTQQKSDINAILAMGQVDTANTNVRAVFTSAFTNAAGPTRTAVNALVSVTGSRAEVLGGYGTVVLSSDVAKALGRG